MSVCKVCEEPLTLRLEDDGDEDDVGYTYDEVTGGSSQGVSQNDIPDDLELSCKCHFHWQCLMDQAEDMALSLQCPSCKAQLAEHINGSSSMNTFPQSRPGSAIMAQYSNEGGLNQQLDILPSINEEAFVESHYGARPARALHIMCSEGDVGGIVDLLRDTSTDQGIEPGFLIRFQNPLADNKSGLHLAVEKQQIEVIMLLLWMSSKLPREAFPPQAIETVNAMGVGRLNVSGNEDVCSIRDSRGRTPDDLSVELFGHGMLR